VFEIAPHTGAHHPEIGRAVCVAWVSISNSTLIVVHDPSSGNVLFILLGAILVLAMHAGFAFLELGTVRKKTRSTRCPRS